MCRSILVFNAHCGHRHTELQKCSKFIAAEAKRKSSFFRRIFSSAPKICKNPKERLNCTKTQVCPNCKAGGITHDKLIKRRDAAERRPPRPLYRAQTDLTPSNPAPALPSSLQRSNAMRHPADQRPQNRQRANTVQFQGEAPQLPNVRATAIFRDSRDVNPDTLRQYLGTPGVPFEGPHYTAYRKPPEPPSTDPRHQHQHRSRSRSQSHSREPSSTSHPRLRDNVTTEYMNRPLPPLPLQPRRRGSSTYRNSNATSQPQPGPSRSSSHRSFNHPRQPQPTLSRSMSQRPPQPPSQAPPTLERTMPQGPSQVPSYFRGRATDKELNRMSREMESAESAWLNTGRRLSQQQPVPRNPIDSFVSPRNHRSQRDGKYA